MIVSSERRSSVAYLLRDILHASDCYSMLAVQPQSQSVSSCSIEMRTQRALNIEASNARSEIEVWKDKHTGNLIWAISP